MTTTSTSVRASDAEREEVARAVQAAGADGRLTMTETEERLAGIYAARFRGELAQFTEDLPQTQPRSPKPWAIRPRGPLVVHGAFVVVIATVIIARWIASGAEYFWPAFPLFWLTLSLVLHARFRGARWRYRRSSTV